MASTTFDLAVSRDMQGIQPVTCSTLGTGDRPAGTVRTLCSQHDASWTRMCQPGPRQVGAERRCRGGVRVGRAVAGGGVVRVGLGGTTVPSSALPLLLARVGIAPALGVLADGQPSVTAAVHRGMHGLAGGGDV